MKVKISTFKKQLREAFKIYVLKQGSLDTPEHEASETEEEEEAEHSKEDPRDDWRKTGKYLYDDEIDEALEVDNKMLTTDPKRNHQSGKYVYGEDDQETFTKLENITAEKNLVLADFQLSSALNQLENTLQQPLTNTQENMHKLTNIEDLSFK